MRSGDEFDIHIPPPEPDPTTGTVDPNAAIPYLAQRCGQGKVAAFTGAGASASAGLPLWSTIGRELKQRLGKLDRAVENIPALAGMYVDEVNRSLGNRRAAKKKLVDLIQNLLYSADAERQPLSFGEIYPRLANLPIDNFYTTNWDQILVQCLIQANRGSVETLDNESIEFQPAPSSGRSRHVVFLHGTVPGPLDQVIVASEDYFEFEKFAQGVFDRLVAQFKTDTTLLCIGYAFGDLNVVNYLQKARTGGHPGSRIYALLPRLSPNDAFDLWRNRGIYPISFDTSGPGIDTWVSTFLDSLLESLDGNLQDFVTPPLGLNEEAPLDRDGEDIEELMRRMEQRSASAGLRSPLEWYTEWPGCDSLRAEDPPNHPLLETVYVEREAKAAVLKRLRTGGKAGISGLLGIGGVGKSFLAMKIAHELLAEGWDVVWVALLDQGTTDALDQLAAAYHLRFIDNLNTEEKIAALRYLFDEVTRSKRKTLVVLDNAERFPNLPLILETLVKVPALITSRTEECRDIIRYHRIESMTEEQRKELCRLYLNEYDEGRFDKLDADDREDLAVLCDYLGGHPLGIRLVLSGFVRRKARARSEKRPFARIMNEISRHGVEAIPAAREPSTGRAGESLHQTVFSTFDWLFQDLPEISPRAGKESKILLPIIAALGADGVDRDSLTAAVSHLKFAEEAKTRNSSWPPRPLSAPELLSSTAEESSSQAADESRLSTAEGEGPPLQETGSSPAGAEQSETEKEAKTNGQADRSPGTEKPHSSSQEPPATKPLSTILDPNPPPDLIPVAFKGPPPPVLGPPPADADRSVAEPPPWFPSLVSLLEKETFDQAIDALISVSLCEATDDSEFFRIHPLIREFSFAERMRADQRRGESLTDGVMHDGPSIEAIFSCALSTLSPSPEYSESLLDLLPRLKGKQSLAKTACNKVLDGIGLVKDKIGNWQLARQFLEKSLELARVEVLHLEEGKLLCSLGELLDRMEFPQGLELLSQGLKILRSDASAKESQDFLWSQAYLLNAQPDEDPHRHIQSLFEFLRQHPAARFTTKMMVQSSLRVLYGEGPSRLQMGLQSAGDNFLTNSILDLSRWLEEEGTHGMKEDILEDAERLFDSTLAKTLEESATNVYINPAHRADLQLSLITSADSLEEKAPSELGRHFGRVLAQAKKAGIRGVSLGLDIGYHYWRRALLAKDWQAATLQAQKNLDMYLEYAFPQRGSQPVSWVVYVLASQAAALPADAQLVASLEARLDTFEQQARVCGRNSLVGWILITRSLLNALPQYADSHLAVKSLVQSRKSFLRLRGAMPPEAEVLYSRAAEFINHDRPVLNSIRRSLSTEDSTAPDFLPWLLWRQGELAARVVSKVDGKVMRLVRGGLQPDIEGRESWSYPFYIDEEPVSVPEYERFLQSDGADHSSHQDSPVYAAGMPCEKAAAYASWAGKRLPNIHEWYVTKWQHAAGHQPEVWPDWQTARRRMYERIRVALLGEVWDRQPILPGQDRTTPTTVPDEWQRQRLEFYLNGNWWRADPELEELFVRRVAETFAHENIVVTEPEAIALASRAAVTTGWFDRSRAGLAYVNPTDELTRAAELSRPEFEQLSDRREKEVERLRETLAVSSVISAKSDFLRWLLKGDQKHSSQQAMETVENLMTGGWLNDYQEVERLFERKILEPVAANEVGFSHQDARFLAISLASSISLTPQEKKRIVRAVPNLSLHQLSELLKILQEEQRKFLALDLKHAVQLEALYVKHNRLVLDWLLGDHSLSVSLGQLKGVWSNVVPDEGRDDQVLLGDPFVDKLWHGSVAEKSENVQAGTIGIRTVLPIFTSSDLDLIDPI